MAAQKKILLDNAYSSWSSAIRCCEALLAGKATLQMRKDFVSNLQNAVELFMKQIMLDKKDFRVAIVKNGKDDGEPARSYYTAADLNAFFENADDDTAKHFYSVEFNEIIKLHRKVLDGYLGTNQTFKPVLELLAKLRNNETHFYIKANQFLSDNEFLELHNFMVEFYKVLEHYDLLPYWGEPSAEHRHLKFDKSMLTNFSYIDVLRNAPLVQKIATEADRLCYMDYPGGSAFRIANAIYSVALDDFTEPFEEVWAYVEVLDQFGMISIEDDSFEHEGFDDGYCHIDSYMEYNFYININI